MVLCNMSFLTIISKGTLFLSILASLNNGKLRMENWSDIASEVSNRCGKTKTPKDPLLSSRINFHQKSRSLSTCMNAMEHSQVALSSHQSTPMSLLLIFRRIAFFHLPRFNWHGVSPMEWSLGYPDYPKNSSICLWHLNRVRGKSIDRFCNLC